MCGRFTLTIDPGEFEEYIPELITHADSIPRYNIAPTQPVAVISNKNNKLVDYYNWGLIPHWAKDPSIGSRMINARSETLAEKPSFKSPFKRKRCLILADGFYEWATIPGRKSKQPVYIYLKSKKIFAFAGLWEEWSSSDGSDILSCTIITTQPNDLIKPIHNRMPVILQPDSIPDWLAPGEQDTVKLTNLLKPYPSDEMNFHQVSLYVNRPQNDSIECIHPIN